ncbi:receptor-like protein kinase HERK 1 isoform X2 [Panicum virgatum]|uniref:receptor-like protein kinase HERK 1 isoform X1 n=1 Tax=Panicum virgatum TaxID=38727 RepID=UPI0019D628B4|nr:receptor-like protein kinase HERK 1 isoform X1 [Panicum virgatum]XP_039813369.1 receptor-like protein kinase HERK 1 isoform X2 [Panicum virgatum]
MDKLQLALILVGIIPALCCFSAAAYTPADNYLISCGSSVGTTVGQRVFVPDDSGSVTLTSSHSAAVRAPPGFESAALYQTARVFTAPSSYAFKISRPGRHFVRLHFIPFASQSYDLAAASFKVSTQDAVLIDSYTPAKIGASPPVPREFLLDVAGGTLIVTFVPLAGGLAFVNAVEVVSVPDNLMADPARTSPGQQLIPVELPLQTAYRVNVGGPAVPATGDTLWQGWTNDQSYLAASAGVVTRELAYNGSLNYLAGEATPVDAPGIVYATARELVMSHAVDQMTWQFDVDKQPSSYLIRFHWCDVVSRAPHLLSIDVYVGSHTVVTGLDLSAIGNGALAFPYHMDFILDSSDPSGKIIIYVGSSSSSMKKNSSAFPGPILNGIEIMKMHFSSGSIVVVEPSSARLKKQNLAIVLGSICGAFAVMSIAVVLVVFLRKKEGRLLQSPSQSPSSTPWMPLLNRFSLRSRGPGASGAGSPSIAADKDMPGAIPIAGSPAPSYRFLLAMLQEATGNFDEGLVIGAGGFGKVYRAVLPDGTKVAVKRASSESRQGAREFRTEIELLSGLRHRHLVSLVGYCDDGDEMILLYEYMEHGSLRSRLYGGGGALSWAQRLEACAGAARGLLYLHTALANPVIHRDVKSSNILLDGGLAAKVADFGLSKAGPELDETHVSTAVKGSFGYVDPDYARTRKLTAKSDVYSFGVVLLEALCARPAVDPRLPKPMVNLVEWALHWQRRGELGKVVDRRIAAAVRPQALIKYGETAARCLAERGADRPAMEDVVWSLQFVMRLQDDSGLDFSDVNSLNLVRELTPPLDPRQRSSHENEAGGEGEGVADGEDTDVSMRGVFWQMVNVGGR